VICGLDAAEIEALLRLILDEEAARSRARDAEQLARVEELKLLESETQRRLDAIAAGVDPLTTEALRGFFEILGQGAVPREELSHTLGQIAARHVEMLDRLVLLDPDDPAIAKLVNRAREDIRLGRYDTADAVLAQAEALERDAIEEAERQLERAERAVRERRFNRAATIAERARLAQTRLRHAEAGRLWQEAAAALPENALGELYDYQMSAALALDSYSEVSGDPSGVDAAIKLFDETVLPLAREIGDDRLWAGATINFGNALQTRGARDPNPRWLRGAVSAFEASLSVFTREGAPSDWALAQSNLGTSLFLLGQRFRDMDDLFAARDAHNRALEVFTRESAPDDYARTVVNLAQVVRNIGQRTANLEMLETSIDLARQGAKVRGELGRESARLSALEEVAKSLESLGELLEDDERLEEAVAVLRTVAAERDIRLEPSFFASTHLKLGDALATLGQRRLGRPDERAQGESDMAAALAAYEAALEVVDATEQAVTWSALRQNAGNVHVILGMRNDDADALSRARLAFEDALTVFTRERFPLEWANTTKNLGMVLFSEAELKEDESLYRAALNHLALSMEELTVERHPLQYAGTRMNMGIIRMALGNLVRDKAVLNEAREDVKAARKVFAEAGSEFWVTNGKRLLDEIAAAEAKIIE
jgi:tetratricopeptide (TPR) repeat protein